MSHFSRSVVDYTFTREDRLFLDANVWLLVYGPRKPDDSRVSIYSDAYRRMLEAKSRIHIGVLLISEIINVIVKLRSNLAKCKRVRDFVDSPYFPPVALEVADVVRRILRECSPLDDGLVAISIDSVIDEYARGRCGFNDRVLMDLCRRERLTLVTDDADFRGNDIAILTANLSVLCDR